MAVTLRLDTDVDIPSGSIVFFTPSDFIGDEIAEITKSSFCHVAIAFKDETGKSLIIECQGGTDKRVVDMDFYKGRIVSVITGYDWHALRDKAMQGLGSQNYDYIECALAGLKDLFREYGVNWSLKSHSSGHICSTFVAQVLGVSDEIVSPGDLFKILTSEAK